MSDDKQPKADKAVKNAGAAEAETAAVAVPKRIVPLGIDRWQIGEFMNTRHSVSPARGTPFEDLLRPEYWANIVRMKPGDIIEVRPEDQSYFAELFVLSRARNSASVAVLREPVKLEPAFKAAAGSATHTVEFAGNHGKWRVIRISDRAVMRDKFDTEPDARAWLAQHERLIAA